MKLRLEIQRFVKGKIPQYVQGTNIWAVSGYQIYRSYNRGVDWEVVGKIPASLAKRFLYNFPPLFSFLRLGIHNLLVLKSGNLLVSISGYLYYSEDGGRTFFPVNRMRVGRKPLHRGICEDRDGNVFYGEYYLNPKRNEKINLYKSTDNGRSFEVIQSFPAGTIRHIHFVEHDPYTDQIWIGTGDRDSECFIAHSSDGGKTFQKIGEGGQCWRAVSLIFTQRFIYWGTDAGSDVPHEKNYIYRWDRNTRALRAVQRVQGPSYYSTVLPNGIFLIGTGVERGKNEVDSCAHLWASFDGEKWENLIQWEKNIWPTIVSHGMIRIPHGQSNIDDEFYFYLVGLRASSGVYHARVSKDY